MNRENLRNDLAVNEKILGKIWGESVYEALNDIKNPDGIIINVGAGVGHFTMHFARMVKKVVAIEPEPRNFDLLRRNVAKNKLKNVCTVKKAAWSCKRKLKLYLSDVDEAGHSVVWEGRKGIEVQGDTLDNILADLGLEKAVIELIKINVEGAELEVLLGAKRCLSRTKRVVMQAHYRLASKKEEGKTTKEVVEFLKKSGFNVYVKIFKNLTEDLVYAEKIINENKNS
jgi:FkbM family methyltransferase